MRDIELGRLLLSLLVLLIAALSVGRIFERLGMTHVVGEIVGGLILGPSILGKLFPNLYAAIFSAFPTQAALLSGFYWLGLILLMFVAGFQVRRELDGTDRVTIGAALLSSLVFPMLAGWHLKTLIDPVRLMNPTANLLSFNLTIAIAAAVTSIPFISRIFIDLGLIGTRFAKIVLVTATLQDLVLWIALAFATALNSSRVVDLSQLGSVVIITFLFLGLAIFLGPPTLLWLARNLPVKRDKASYVGYVLIVCFSLSAAASFLSVNVVFGALVAGIVIGSLPGAALTGVKQQITEVSLWLFVPIYFSMVGLKIDLSRHFDLEMTVIFIIVTSAVKMFSVGFALRVLGEPWPVALNYGVAMNTRGGPGIVLASVALEFGIITESFFVTLVLTSIVTSLFTGGWLRMMQRHGHAF